MAQPTAGQWLFVRLADYRPGEEPPRGWWDEMSGRQVDNEIESSVIEWYESVGRTPPPELIGYWYRDKEGVEHYSASAVVRRVADALRASIGYTVEDLSGVFTNL